jgi:hypothetical protein
MQNLDKIYEYVKASTMILIINNNSKSLLDSLFNIIYNKYDLSKCKVESTRKLMLKLSTIKNKLIRHESDLSRIQFGSSRNSDLVTHKFSELKTYLIENNSKLLLKYDIHDYKLDEELKSNFDYNLHRLIPQYNHFNLIILIGKNDIKIIRLDVNDYSFIYLYRNEDITFNLTPLIRNTKLKKLKKISTDN